MGILIAGVISVLPACHRGDRVRQTVPEPELSQTDKDFVKQSEAVDVQERAVAQLVKERSKNRDLKKLQTL